MRKRLIFLTVLAVMAMSAVPAFAAEYGGAGGIGCGNAVGENSSANQAAALNTLTGTTTVTSLIRAGQTISTISRSSNTVTVVLTATYPNSNLKAGQSIVISGVGGFSGTFTIAAVASQTQFTYAQTGANATGAVDASSTAGGHYTMLTTWEADRQGDITAAGRNTMEIAECYNDWTTAAPLTDAVTLSGWTTDSTHYVKIYTPASERHKRKAGTGFMLKCSNGSPVYAINIATGAGYTVIEGLEIIGPATLDNSQYAVVVNEGVVETVIRDNIIHGFSDTSGGYGISSSEGPCYIYRNIIYDIYGTGIGVSVDNNGQFYIYNNILYNCTGQGIRIRRSSYVYNNTAYNCGYGIWTNTTNAQTVRNNLCISSTTADYELSTCTNLTASNNISSDATAPGTSSLTGKTVNDVKFVSRTTGYEDYRVQPDSVAVGAGTNLSATFTDDCDQHTRTGWDVGADEAAKEFVCNIRAAGATNPAPDYNKISDWENALDATDYTLNTARVFSGAKTGTINDNASVTLYRGGSSQSITATVLHASSSQILVRTINPAPSAGNTFQVGDQWWVDASNYFTVSAGGHSNNNAGDTVRLVAECYNDWPAGLDDSVQLGGDVAVNTIHADAQHKVIIRTPLSQRHNGTAHTGFYLKPTVAVSSEFFSLIQGWYASDYEFDGLEIDGSGRAAASTAFLIRESSKNITIKNCLIHDMGSPSAFAQAILSYATAPYVQNLQIYNNIFYNISGCALIIPASNEVYFYNNTIYNTNSRDESSYGGVYLGSTSLVKNNVAIGNYRYDFRGTPFASGSGYNCSSDATATSAGTNALTSKTAANNFVSTTAGAEDLRLKAGADAATAGTVLSSDAYIPFSTDIEGDDRSTTNNWSIGADEYMAYTWAGTTSTDWAVATNWNRGKVPGVGAQVTIPSTVNQPVLSASTTIKTLTMTGGSLTLNAAGGVNLTVTGDVTMSGGTFAPNSNTITCGGSMNLTGSTFTYATSTINMNSASGTKTLTLPAAVTCYNLTFSGAGTFNFGNANVAVSHNFTQSAGTVTAPTGTLTCVGDFNTTGGTFTAGSGTVALQGCCGTTHTITGSQTFNNFTFYVPGVDTVYYVIASGTILTVNGTLAYSGNAISASYVNTGDIHAKGDITLGLGGGGNATITINGTGNQTITGSSNGNVPKIVINKASGNLTLSGVINSRSDWTFTSMGTGSLITTGSTVTFMDGTITGSHALNNVQFLGYQTDSNTIAIASNTTLTVGGTLSITGAYTDSSVYINTGNISAQGDINITNRGAVSGTATITLNGTGTQTITGNTTMGQGRLPNVVINKTGTVTTVNKIQINGTTTVTAGTLSLGDDTTFGAGAVVASGATLSCTTPGKTITFHSGSTYTVDSGGYVTFQGSAASKVILAPSTTSAWNFNVSGGYLIDNVSVSYSTAGSDIYATNSTNGGNNNANWHFTAAGGGTTATWAGGTSTAWNLPANWGAFGRLPGAEDDVVIPTGGGTNKPTIPAGTYTYKSFTATAGAYTITCAGDKTAINSASGGTSAIPHGIGVTINTTGAIDIGTGVTMSANNQGFPELTGPGAYTPNGGHYGAGGSYGGRGGHAYGLYGCALPYGSVTQPTALGSGGSMGSSVSGDGGGAIKLNASNGTVTVNGTISANGESTGRSGGSGGSIWIIANTLAGAGSVATNGGGGHPTYGSGGSGGRIRLTWTTKTFSGTVSTAGGVTSTSIYGHAGTLSVPDNTDLTVNNSIALAPGTYNIPNLTVTNNAKLECQGDTSTTNGSGVIINATTVTVDAGAKITADGLGFGMNSGPGTAAYYDYYGGGGGYGGKGGDYSVDYVGGIAYGSPVEPNSLGSGGAGNPTNLIFGIPFYAGGAVKVNASGAITLNGTISSNADVTGGAACGSAGGSVWIIANTLSGTGSITADGGNGETTYSTGGGGGRVAVYSASYSNTLSSVTVNAGTGATGKAGINGTIVYSPIGGYTAENAIPAAQCAQSASADGLVTVTFKVKDPGDAVNATTGINNNHILKTFEYSVDGGTTFSNIAAAAFSGYSYYKTITIDHTKVAGDLTNFPVLVSVTDNDLRTAANGGDVTNASGYDIIFADAAGDTQLNHEIEKYDATTGQFIAWVKVPALSAASDTVIRIYYKNSAIAASQENKTGTWDANFKGVWHMPDGTTLTANDSTAGNNGTVVNAVAGAGKVDGAGSFDGAGDYGGVGDYISVASPQNAPTTALTISAWIKPAVSVYGGTVLAWSAGSGLTNGAWLGVTASDNGATGYFLYLGGVGTNTASVAGDSFDSNWHHVVVTYNGSNIYYYRDGVNGASDPATGTITYSANPLLIGISQSTGGYRFNGLIDEVHVSSSARSAAWIATEYNNQNSPATFYSIGSETTNGGTVASLAGGWPDNSSSNYTGDSTFAAASAQTFTFNTKHASLAGLNSVEQNDVMLRFKVKDKVTQSAVDYYASSQSYATSDAFIVDNAAPAGLANLAVTAATATSASLSWTAASETYFNTYEIWYGQTLTDVQNRSGAAVKVDKNTTGCSDLGTVSTAAITIPDLNLTSGIWYFEIYAVDNYGNTATTTYVSFGSGTITWNGATSTAWETATNWTPNIVPATAAANVVIPATATRPTLSASTTIGSLSMTGGQLTFNAAGGVNLTVVGDVTMSGGTFTPNSNTLTCGGNLNLNGSTFTYATSTINMNGSSGTKTITLSSTGNVYSMTFTGGATYQLPVAVNVNGAAWTVSGGSTIDATTNSSTVTLNAGTTFTGSHTLNNVTFSASSNRIYTIDPGTILTVSGTLATGGDANVTLNTGNIYAQGNITLGNTGTNGGGTSTITINGTGNQILTGTATINQSKIPNLVINKPSGTLTLTNIISTSASWTYTTVGTPDTPASFISTGSTVCFVNSSSIVITGSHALNNVIVDSSGSNCAPTIDASTTLTVNGTLTISGASARNVSLSTGNISAKGNITITNDGVNGGGTGTITLNGTGTQTITGPATIGQGKLPNVTINKTGNVVTAGKVSIARTTTVTSGTLSLGDDTSFGENFTVASGATLACTTPGTTLTFHSGSTYSVDSGGYLTFQGSAANKIILAPSTTSAWLFNVSGGYLMDNVSVSRSNADGGSDIYATNSTNGGNNSSWTFTVSGGGLTDTWLGGISTAWNNPGNWTLGRLPGAEDDVEIPSSGGTNKPTIPAGTYTYKSFTAQTGGYTITCKGDVSAINTASGGTTSVPHGSGVAINTSGNFYIGSNATLSANQQGFANAAGPGASSNSDTPGGYGGEGYSRFAGTSTYGSVTQPTALGSGGGGTSGSTGGGAIKINSAGTVTVDGSITATANGSVFGTGTGGSIWIIANAFAGGGYIAAEGGVSSARGGGGGGRVALSWTTSTFGGWVSVAGGTSGNSGSGYGSGHPGTLSFPDNISLTVNNGSVISTSSMLSTKNIALAPGTYNIPTLTVSNNATLDCQADRDGDPVNGAGVIINATTVTVDSGSTISAQGLGFTASGPGGTATNDNSSSHGGEGNSYGSGAIAGPTYGSAVEPLSIGSGGSQSSGGGAIKLNVSGTATINGVVTAEGGPYSASGSITYGGGAGGSIWINADTLAGTGVINAKGGNTCCRPGGGGGRIAFYYSQYNNTLSSVTVAGGTGGDGINGFGGTVVYSPVGGYSADNQLPAAQCAQSSSGNGVATVTFKIRDPGDTVTTYSGINSNHAISDFEYSTDGGATFNSAAGSISDTYNYKRMLTIDKSKIGSGGLTDFPLLINSTINSGLQASLKDAAHSGNVQSSSGYDIIITDASGNKLSHEIEKYDPATGEFIAWANIPTLPSATDTDIYIYYGKSGVIASQEDKIGTWRSGYKAVYHMNEAQWDDTTGAVKDSAMTNNATRHGSATTTASGKIGSCGTFSSATQDSARIVGRFYAMGDVRGNGLTYSAWFKTSTYSGTGLPIAGASGGIAYSDMTGGGVYLYPVDSGLQKMGSQAVIYGGGYLNARSTTKSNDNLWHYIVGTLNLSSSAMVLYVDGASVGTSSTVNLPQMNLEGKYFWIAENADQNNYFTGTIDEVRVSNTQRSAQWIITEYNNQNAPQTFFKTIGAETATGSVASYPTGLIGASTFAGATGNQFLWNTKSAGLSGLDGSESSNIKIRFRIKDQINQGMNNWYCYSNSYLTSDAVTVDNKAPVFTGALSVPTITSTTATLNWSAATDLSFSHYEIWYGTNQSDVNNRTGTAAEWDNDNDAALATATTAATTITGLTSGQTYYFKIWAVDSYGSESTLAAVSKKINTPPTAGYSADNVIPAAQCAQAADGTGNEVITYKIKDPQEDNCSIKSGSFQYQVNGGGWINVSDAHVTGTKTGLSSATDWGVAVEHTLTWASRQYINNTDVSTVQVRFTLNDGMDDSASPVTSDNFRADNVYPTLSSWALNMSAGTIAITFSEILDASETDITKIILQDAATATVGRSYTLTNSTASQSDSTTITITLSSTDLNAIKAISGMAKAESNSYIRFDAGAVKDLFKNNIAAVLDGSAVKCVAGGYTADTAAITLSSWTLNMHTQTVQLAFSEAASVGTFDASKFTIQDDAGGTHTYALAGTYTQGAYANLTAGQYALGGTSNMALRVKLTTTDFNALMDDANIVKAQGSSYLVIGASSGLRDMAATPNVLAAVAATNAATYTANTVTAVYFQTTTTGRITSASMTAGDLTGRAVYLYAMDANFYRTPTYEGAKTIVFSGAVASPDGNAPLAGGSTNGFTAGVGTSITFTKGIGSTTVRLFNRETALIAGTDTAGSVTTPEGYRLSIAVSSEAKSKLAFTQQPSAAGTINVAFAQQPIVEVRDLYGNRVIDATDQVTLYDSRNHPPDIPNYLDGPGTLTNATVAASAGTATFANVSYNNMQYSIYLQARATGLQSAFSSNTITFSTSGTSTVDAAASPLVDFNLSPINDSEAEKFAVLKFKVTDAGGDMIGTLIDQIRIAVSGTGGNALTDIAWAGLYKDNGATLVQTASSIANDYITFGSTPNSNSSAGIESVADGTGTEYTVYIYMKNSKLTATDTQTYTFGVNEGLIGVDSGTSSQMVSEPHANVGTVSGTIKVDVTHLYVVTAAGAETLSVTAGNTAELAVRAVDANKNIDVHYGVAPGENKTLRFSGLNAIQGIDPTIEDFAFGNNTTITFLSGVSQANAVTLAAYKRESGTVEARQYSGQNSLYSVYALAVTVDSLKANLVSATSGDGQIGKTSKALPNLLVATTSDSYGNTVTGVNMTFAITAPASGATLSVSSGSTDINGQLTTALTLGTVSKTYTVTATATGPAEKVEGTPSVNFTAIGRIPLSISKTGDNQTQNISTQLASPFVAKLVDAAGNPIPNETITFAFAAGGVPAGATGHSISSASGTTDSNGEVSTTLTLGNRTGSYIVTSSYAGGPSLSVDFTGTAQTPGPSTVTLTGPSSITAGASSTAFTVSITDDAANVANVTSDTVFNLSSNSSGHFYSDSGCTAQVTTATVPSGSASAIFYYKQDAAGSITLTAARASGQSLGTRSTHSMTTTIVPAALDHFVLSGQSALTAGVSTNLTVSAYDVHNNLRTNFSGALSVRFRFNDSVTHTSPAGNAPTCAGSTIGNLTTGGAAASLTFTNGNATAALILYKPETALVLKAYTDSGINTADANDLHIATVIHNTADHTKFTAGLSTPQNVGAAFNFATTLTVTDAYDNICDGANGASAYDSTPAVNNVTWTLSGAADSPDGSHTDSITSRVNFENGVSTTALSATLYRAQTTTLTAAVSGVAATARANQPSSSIVVNPGAINKLWFSQQPSANATTGQAFASQPSVSVADQYGNATNSAGSITLAAYLDNDGDDTAPHGLLSSDSANNTKALSAGVAAFTGMQYSYPETIYLKATVSGQNLTAVYSTAAALLAATDLTTTGITTSATISSIRNADIDRQTVYEFRVTDAGTDGRDGELTRIIINRDYGAGGTDTSGDLTNYINSAIITDGTTQRIGTVAANTITFGDGSTAIYTLPDGTNKTMTLRISLKTTLPTGADGKVLGLRMDANTDISVTATSSTFAAVAAITGTTTVNVIATDLVVTAPAATMNAGETLAVTLTAKDINGNTDTGYHNIVAGKAITFSGASISGASNAPTCSNYGGSNVAFGTGTDILFNAGVGTTTMILYAAENASISATDGTVTTRAVSALSVVVTAGAISNLSWSTQPAVDVVTNAPWRSFILAVADAYGNTVTSGTQTVTVALSGTTGDVAVAGAAVTTATAAGGLATFPNFYVTGTGTTRLVATAGAYSSAASSLVTVAANYTVNATVKDSLSNTALTDVQLTVTQSGSIVYGPNTSRSGVFNFTLPYGTYTFNIKKEAYVDADVETTASTSADGADGTYDNIINLSLTLTSVTEATADYKVMNSFVYDEDSEDMTIRLWLERRGILITNSAMNVLGSATVEVYDSTTARWLTTVTLTPPAAADLVTGTYTRTLADVLSAGNAFGTPLVAGKSYFAKCKIGYGGSDGTRKTYEAGATFTISVTQKLSREIISKMGLAEGETVASKLAATNTAVAAAQTAITGKVTEVKTETAKILTAAETTIPAAVTTAKTAITDIVKSEILNRQQTVKSGGTITMRYRTYTGLAPKIDVYNADNTLKVIKGSMTEIGTTGVYEYDVKFLSAWGTGDFTIVCSESTKGTLDAMTIMVLTADIESISSQISGVQGATSGITDIKNTTAEINSQFSALETALSKISSDIVSKVTDAKTAVGDLELVYRQLVNISGQIKGLGATKDMDLGKIYEVSKEKKTDIMYLKNKTQELKAAMDLNQKMIENVAKKPVVQTWFEFK